MTTSRPGEARKPLHPPPTPARRCPHAPWPPRPAVACRTAASAGGPHRRRQAPAACVGARRAVGGQGSGFRFQDSGFRVQGSGFRVDGIDNRRRDIHHPPPTTEAGHPPPTHRTGRLQGSPLPPLSLPLARQCVHGRGWPLGEGKQAAALLEGERRRMKPARAPAPLLPGWVACRHASMRGRMNHAAHSSRRRGRKGARPPAPSPPPVRRRVGRPLQLGNPRQRPVVLEQVCDVSPLPAQPLQRPWRQRRGQRDAHEGLMVGGQAAAGVRRRARQAPAGWAGHGPSTASRPGRPVIYTVLQCWFSSSAADIQNVGGGAAARNP